MSRRVVRFEYEGRYWSLPIAAWNQVAAEIRASRQIPDFGSLKAKRLSRKPHDAGRVLDLDSQEVAW